MYLSIMIVTGVYLLIDVSLFLFSPLLSIGLYFLPEATIPFNLESYRNLANVVCICVLSFLLGKNQTVF